MSWVHLYQILQPGERPARECAFVILVCQSSLISPAVSQIVPILSVSSSSAGSISDRPTINTPFRPTKDEAAWKCHCGYRLEIALMMMIP